MNPATSEGKKPCSLTSACPCRLFSLAEIHLATKNFDDELVIGKGGFGKVYKGRIAGEEGDVIVAIKRRDYVSNQGEFEFRSEIDMLSKLRHCHLVSLIGYCHDNMEMILVYEYMPNGTLYHHLHKADTPLSWVARLKIAIGAARGLDYLHTGVGTLHGVIHRDVKSSNIFLDENWAAMISDFGLSKIGPTNQSISFLDASVKGTFGYLDPEYFYTRKLTRKTDVYAFGVVLFELVSGRLPVDERYGEEQCSLVRWAQKCVKEKKLELLVDSNIKGTISPKCLRRFAQIADRCVHSVLKDRPTLTEVVASLQVLLELQKQSNHSSRSTSIMGFTWKMHKYFVSTPKPNYGNISHSHVAAQTEQSSATLHPTDQHEISSPKILAIKNLHEELVTRGVKMFTHRELKHTTTDFRGRGLWYDGSNAWVYKGWVDKETYSLCKDNAGLPIVVKAIHHARVDFKEKELVHANLVKLIGYGWKDEYLLLVYEFMHKGNLKDLLSTSVRKLPLETKVKILQGIARGIVFLHSDKPSLNASEFLLEREKILLNENFTAKLSDEYPRICEMDLILKSERCCFIMILVEVLAGKCVFRYCSIEKVNRLFNECGKESLESIGELCLEICNEVDSGLKMLAVLKEYVHM